VEAEVVKKKKTLEKVLDAYRKELVLDIYIKRDGNFLYWVTASLNMHKKLLPVEGKGSMPVYLVSNVLDRLKDIARKEMLVERKEYLWERKNRTMEEGEDNRTLLEEHVRNEDRKSFKRVLKKIFPEIEQHIRTEIGRQPVLRKLIKKNIIQPEDIVEEIYQELFLDLKENSDTSEKIILWAFRVADSKINELTKSLAEKYNKELAANGINRSDFEQRIDEEEYNQAQYDLSEILSDAGAETIIRKLEEEDKNINIPAVLRQLPEDHQSVFELNYLYSFSVSEISKIKNITGDKIGLILQEVRQQIVNRL
jgi:RNA polymerase sigma factor (sigma-70 family)